MKKLFSAILSLAMAFSVSTASVQAAPQPEKKNTKLEQSVPGELVVALEKESSIQSNDGKAANPNKELNRKKQSLKKYGFDVADSIMNYDEMEVASNKGKMSFQRQAIDKMGYVYLVKYDTKKYDQEKAQKEIKKMLRNSGLSVKYVEPNYVSTATGIHAEQSWHYNLIKVPQAWNTTRGSSSVKVAVLDTGIDHNHPALRNFVNTSLGKTYYSGTTMDYKGHGTHVAGTIASSGIVSGVMQNATLIPVKVLNDEGKGSNYNISQGILHAVSVGADVINMSLGGGYYDQTMDNACSTAVANGTVIAAATGNDGYSTVSYPAAYEACIAVGSVDSDRSKSWFSNYGSALDIMAPGNEIYSTYPGSQYGLNSGTSMATPHVAGVLGLMKAANPNLSPAQARSIVESTAMYAGSAFEYGSGIIDAEACVKAASGGGGTEPGPGPQPELATSTTLSSQYTYYYRGETPRVTATVRDQDNAPLANATVRFTITRPDGTSASATGYTNSSGQVAINVSTSSYSATGLYKITAQTSLSGYTTSQANLSFSLY